MPVLIVESDVAQASLWKAHIESTGSEVIVTSGQAGAVTVLQTRQVRVILLTLELTEGSALAVVDFASYRQPQARVIILTRSGLFSDGSIFSHAPNACAFLPRSTPPADLAMMVEHYGRWVSETDLKMS